MKKHLCLLGIFVIYCLSGLAQLPSQTRTADLFNNITEAYLNLWAKEGPERVSANDNVYAYSKKLSSGRGFLLLVLRDFDFNIPSDATIESITVSVRRFKTGSGSVSDYFATLIREPIRTGSGTPYGVRWTDPNNYPDVESEVLYTQSGTGNNGGLEANQVYQWTPAMINDPGFGVRIDIYRPQGSVVVYYDLVQITVQHSGGTITRKSPVAAETMPLKAPIVYPNPFTTKTSIRFTAAETGSAVVELYNISGAKVQTLFSGNVYRGQEYHVQIGDAQLAKGVYIYSISNNNRKYTGRITKLE